MPLITDPSRLLTHTPGLQPWGYTATTPTPPSRFGFLYDMFCSSNVTPQQTRKLLGVGGGLGLATSFFTGGFGFNFDTLLNVGAIASIFCPALVLPVALGYLAKASTNIFSAVGCLLGGDIGGVASNLLAGALTAVCALPFGKIGALKELWNSTKTFEDFLYAGTKLCYGADVARSTAGVIKGTRGLIQNQGSTRSVARAAGQQDLGFIERVGKSWQTLIDRFRAGRQSILNTPVCGLAGGGI